MSQSAINPAPLKRVLIMAGGTGGHVFPALAVAKAFQEQGTEIKWLGTRKGIEAKLVPENGIELAFLEVAGVRGQGLRRLLLAPWKIFVAIVDALSIYRKFRPDLALGMGGFVTGPGGVAAWLARTPLCIHEQNAIAGFTNKKLAPFARCVLQAFPQAFTSIASDKLVTTGNPVRAQISAIQEPLQRLHGREGAIRVLILGGSQGAVALNEMIPKAFSAIADQQNFVIRHQAGGKNLAATQQAYQNENLEAEVLPFISDMAAAYAWADVVICRSGALTVAELAAAGVAAVLIPYPYAVDDHQTKNAEYLAKPGAAILLQQKQLEVATLAKLLTEHLSDRAKLLNMAKIARSLALPQATEQVVENCKRVVHG